MNFDGGTLLASGSNASFMSPLGLTDASVEELGGVINNGGFAITIAQGMQTGGINPVDGGLLFLGAGTTTLSGTSTYNGGTTVIGGTLIATDSQAIEDGTSLSVGSGLLAFAGAVIPSPKLLTRPLRHELVSPVPELGITGVGGCYIFGGAAIYPSSSARSRGRRKHKLRSASNQKRGFPCFDGLGYGRGCRQNELDCRQRLAAGAERQ